MTLESTQPLTEVSTRNLPEGKGRPGRKAENLTAICKPIVWRTCGNLDASQLYGTPLPVTGIALPLQFFFNILYFYTINYRHDRPGVDVLHSVPVSPDQTIRRRHPIC
jgi:hypothetical protein